MMLLSMKTYLALLWGTSVLYESTSAPVPKTSMNSTAEPNKTTEQGISARAVHSETETQPATWHPTHRPAEVSVAATAEASVSPTVETVETVSANRSDSTAGLVVMDTVAATTSSSGPRLLHTSAAATTVVSEAQPLHSGAGSETAKPTEDELHQRSPTTSTDTSAPAKPSAATSTASLATAAVSSLHATSTTKPEVASELSSTTSPAASTTQAPVFIQTLSSPSASTKTTTIVKHTAALVFEPTSTTSSNEISSTPQPVSVTAPHITTSEFPKPAGLSSTTGPRVTSTDSAITTTAVAAFSTSPTGIWIPRLTKRLPIPTTKSTLATTKVTNSPASTEVPPCSSWGLVKHCLIAIASLAGLATVFMVSTIILCAKLSTRKYKVKKPQQSTEMMCISALLPESNYSYTRQRNPVTNGVLVIHSGGDSDEDGGDNLTLSSFLPENDRLV